LARANALAYSSRLNETLGCGLLAARQFGTENVPSFGFATVQFDKGALMRSITNYLLSNIPRRLLSPTRDARPARPAPIRPSPEGSEERRVQQIENQLEAGLASVLGSLTNSAQEMSLQQTLDHLATAELSVLLSYHQQLVNQQNSDL
jgi:hypothetical protein